MNRVMRVMRLVVVCEVLVKIDPNAPESRRYARYIPAWA